MITFIIHDETVFINVTECHSHDKKRTKFLIYQNEYDILVVNKSKKVNV